MLFYFQSLPVTYSFDGFIKNPISFIFGHTFERVHQFDEPA